MPNDDALKGVDPSEYKNIPGNQTANTPDVNESEQRRRRSGDGGTQAKGDGGDGGAQPRGDGGERGRSTDPSLKGVDPSEYKNIPGNQTANTPDINESEQPRHARR